MADDPLVEQLAGVAHQILDEEYPDWHYQCTLDEPKECFKGDQARRWIAEDLIGPLLSWLAERGRLVPDEAHICDEWGTHQGIREHRQVITTPWVAVPAEEAQR